LDKRKLYVRSSHAALNTLLQSAGALISKQWLVEMKKAFEERGWDVKQVVWCHDEVQLECSPDIAEEVGKVATECATKAGEYFNFRIRIDAEYKVGNNWMETH
jgi:DNA polymerase I-like protein with 3'-5' exonuclease and polymerase domains